jgi:hypothetical protein
MIKPFIDKVSEATMVKARLLGNFFPRQPVHCSPRRQLTRYIQGSQTYARAGQDGSPKPARLRE